MSGGPREKPFSLSTDPRFVYRSGAHERATLQLLEAIRARTGTALLTAPRGMGKTTLCRALMDRVDQPAATSLVLEPPHSLDEVLKRMLVDFGVIAPDDAAASGHLTRQRLMADVRAFVEAHALSDGKVLVVVDEAQNVAADVLADLALLVTRDVGSTAGIQLVLVGQPSLLVRLNHADLRKLIAGVSHRIELGPLRPDEVSRYIAHRLAIGGETAITFDSAAVDLLFGISAGVPRVVNLLCDRAMMRGQQVSGGVLGAPLVEAAAADFELTMAGEQPRPFPTMLIGVLFALLVIVGGLAAAWRSREAIHHAIVEWEQVPPPPIKPVRRLPDPIVSIPPPAEPPIDPQPGSD